MMDEYEYGKEPDWKGESEFEIPADVDSTQRNVIEMLIKSEIRGTRYEIWAPFSCDTSKKFMAGIIFEGKGRYWYIEGKSEKFNNSEDAMVQVLENLEVDRQAMMNQEFDRLID